MTEEPHELLKPLMYPYRLTPIYPKDVKEIDRRLKCLDYIIKEFGKND